MFSTGYKAFFWISGAGLKEDKEAWKYTTSCCTFFRQLIQANHSKIWDTFLSPLFTYLKTRKNIIFTHYLILSFR